MKTLYDSFRDYVAVKTLAGEYGYQTGEFGLQDARAAVAFQALPPVLHLQLKRYEYDTQRDIVVRVRITSWMGYWFDSNLIRRSTIVSNSPSKLTSMNFSTRRPIEPDHGGTNFTVCSYTLVPPTADITSFSSNQICIPGGSNSMTAG